jgi:hypothetical protein
MGNAIYRLDYVGDVLALSHFDGKYEDEIVDEINGAWEMFDSNGELYLTDLDSKFLDKSLTNRSTLVKGILTNFFVSNSDYSGKFCIEYFIKFGSENTDKTFTLAKGAFFNNTWAAWAYSRVATSVTKFYCWIDTNGGRKYAEATFPTDNEWHHLAFVSTGSNIIAYIDGIGNTPTPLVYDLDMYDIFSNGARITINSSAQGIFVSDLRITINASVYTDNFTPPTSPLTIDITELENKRIRNSRHKVSDILVARDKGMYHKDTSNKRVNL